MSPAHPIAVLLDPAAEMSEELDAIEDWLGWAEAESPEDEHARRAGAAAAGELAAVVRGAARRAPALFAPGGRVELAPVLVVSCDLERVVASLQRGVAVPQGGDDPLGARHLLGVLERAAAFAVTEHCRVLVDAAPPGAEAVVLSEVEQRAYVRCVVAILTDFLDRFLALGPAVPGCRDLDAFEACGLEG